MKNHLSTPLISLNGQHKDSDNLPQTQQVSKAFFEKPKTTLQVAIETGIYRANITRYVGKWKKADKIAVVKIGVCPITKEKGVQYLTTNPAFFPKQRQLNLFEPTKTE